MADTSPSVPAPESFEADKETDWPSQITSSIVGYIDQVREKTTKPALLASRGVVFGLLILMFIPVALVLLAISAIRLAEVGFRAFFEWDSIGISGDHAVWSSYLLWGFLFFVVGSILFKKRKPTA